MNSIRAFLLFSLAVSLTIIMSISAVYVYRTSIHEIDEIYDAQLAQYTRLIATQPADGSLVAAPVYDKIESGVGHKYEYRISFQVWDEDRHMLQAAGSSQAGEQLGPFIEGYHDVAAHDGKLWKIFVLHDSRA